MSQHQPRAEELAAALQECDDLRKKSAPLERLWFLVRDVVCTRSVCHVTPMGSKSAVSITPEYATDELLAAMDWLRCHEAEARELTPSQLFIMLRGVATRGASGSARMAQSDALHGITNVVPGSPIAFTYLDLSGAPT